MLSVCSCNVSREQVSNLHPGHVSDQPHPRSAGGSHHSRQQEQDPPHGLLHRQVCAQILLKLKMGEGERAHTEIISQQSKSVGVCPWSRVGGGGILRSPCAVDRTFKVLTFLGRGGWVSPTTRVSNWFFKLAGSISTVHTLTCFRGKSFCCYCCFLLWFWQKQDFFFFFYRNIGSFIAEYCQLAGNSHAD